MRQIVEPMWVTRGLGTATLAFTVKPAAPVITSALTAPARVGITFGYQITATNSPTSFTATGVPNGLTLNATTGTISGHPTAPGTFDVALKATNSGGTGTATFVITVKPVLPVITGTLTATARVGAAIGYQIATTNNPTSFAISGLPGGLSLETTTRAGGSGTPATADTFNATLKAAAAVPPFWR